jgi:hypothetical protein
MMVLLQLQQSPEQSYSISTWTQEQSNSWKT